MDSQVNMFRKGDQKARKFSGVRTRCVHRAAGQRDGWERDEVRGTTGNRSRWTFRDVKTLAFILGEMKRIVGF